METKPASSWRREPWPWLLMAGPLAVIVGGLAVSAIAFTGADGLVADDYYRQGLAINRTLARDTAARTLGVEGEVLFEDGSVRATLAARSPLPDRIRLTLVHATRAGEDRVAMLARDSSGAYSAPLPPVPAARWGLVLETRDWRVATRADLRHRRAIRIDTEH